MEWRAEKGNWGAALLQHWRECKAAAYGANTWGKARIKGRL